VVGWKVSEVEFGWKRARASGPGASHVGGAQGAAAVLGVLPELDQRIVSALGS
jgi:hypothetical protein